MRRTSSYILPAVVVLFLLVYVARVSGFVTIPSNLGFLSFLALGPLGIMGCLELGRVLDGGRKTAVARLATVYGVVAFAIWTVVHVVQVGTAALWRDHLAADLVEALPGGTPTVRLLFRGVGTVQATMDVAFDLFYCLAVLLFSVLMLSTKTFRRAIAIFGVLSAAGLLTLNLWTFPMPPREAGLVDLGPLTGVWWILVVFRWTTIGRDKGVDDA